MIGWRVEHSWRSDGAGGKVRRTLWLALVLLLALLGGEAPRAQGSPPPGLPSLEESGLRPATPVFSQFPFESIDLINRNVQLRFVDLRLPGNGGFDLTFVRTHNSRDGQWRFGIEQAPLEMRKVAGGQACSFADQWAFYWVDGSVEYSDCDVDPGGPDVLSTSRFGEFTKSEFKLKLASGLVATYGGPYSFDRRLEHLEDTFGNTVDFTWTLVDYDGTERLDLTQVAQHVGGATRYISFDRYHAKFHGGDMTMSFDGKTWRYIYEPTNLGALHTLEAVEVPAGPGWTFDYWTFGDPVQAGQFILAVKHVGTPNGGTIDYTYEWENASSYTCGCTFLAAADRSVNDGAQTATWTLDSDFLAFQHYTRVNNPDGTRLTYLFEKKDGGNFFKTVVPDSRVLVRLSTGATLEEEDYDHQLVQHGIHYTPVLTRRDLSRDGRHYITDLFYEGAPIFKPTRIEESGELSRTTHIQYAALSAYLLGRVGQRTVVSDGQTLVETRQYNGGNGFLESQTTVGVTTTFAEGAHGNADSITDARGKTTALTYEWGVVKNTYTPEYTIARSINVDGSVASEDRGNTHTTFSYDGLGRVTQVDTHTPGRQVTITDYDSGGHWMKTSQGANSTTTHVDGFGRLGAALASDTRALCRVNASYPRGERAS